MTMTDYRTLAAQTAERYGLPTNLFTSLIAGESSWNPWAVGSAGEIGLGQLMPGTASDLGVNPWDPAQNLSGAASYLKQNFERFGNWRDALSAYKGGPGNVSSSGALSAAEKVLKAAGMGPLGLVEAAAQGAAGQSAADLAAGAFSWANPWPWLKARGLDIGFGALGVLLVVASVFMLTKTGGAFSQGVRSGARDALRGAA